MKFCPFIIVSSQIIWFWVTSPSRQILKKYRSKGLEEGGMCNFGTYFRTRSFGGILDSVGSDRWGNGWLVDKHNTGPHTRILRSGLHDC